MWGAEKMLLSRFTSQHFIEQSGLAVLGTHISISETCFIIRVSSQCWRPAQVILTGTEGHPPKGLGKLVGELPQLSLRGFLRGQEIARESSISPQGSMSTCRVCGGKFATLMCRCGVPQKERILDSLVCHWTWSWRQLFPCMFALPGWPLEGAGG